MENSASDPACELVQLNVRVRIPDRGTGCILPRMQNGIMPPIFLQAEIEFDGVCLAPLAWQQTFKRRTDRSRRSLKLYLLTGYGLDEAGNLIYQGMVGHKKVLESIRATIQARQRKVLPAR